MVVRLQVSIRRLIVSERSVTIATTRVRSDYVGWVFIDMEQLTRRLAVGLTNYGLKITVQDENNVPWNIPDLFVKMDCNSANESKFLIAHGLKLILSFDSIYKYKKTLINNLLVSFYNKTESITTR